MVKLGKNIVGFHNELELPKEVIDVLSKPDLRNELQALKTEDGKVQIIANNVIYEITYVRVIPPSDCMEEFKRRQNEKLLKTFNV